MRPPAWLLLVLLSAGSCLSAVDVGWLTDAVKTLRNQYKIDGQFCLATSIPPIPDPEKSDQISEQLGLDNVYQSEDLIVATPSDEHGHAEGRVLAELSQLQHSATRNFLLIYSPLSPCPQCAAWMKNSADFRNALKNWANAAFVFTTVFNQPKDGHRIGKQDLEKALRDLGDSMGGLDNVYRCYGHLNQFHCDRCSSDKEVCTENTPTSAQSGDNGGLSWGGFDAGGGGGNSNYPQYDYNGRHRGGEGKKQQRCSSKRSSKRSSKNGKKNGKKSCSYEVQQGGGNNRRSSSSEGGSRSSSRRSGKRSSRYDIRQGGGKNRRSRGRDNKKQQRGSSKRSSKKSRRKRGRKSRG